MAISVYAFGTGGKRKRIFQDIYFSVEDNEGVGVVYTKNGEYAAILRMENPVDKYSADIDGYYEYTRLFTAIAQTLGEGYALHKQDVFVRKAFKEENGGNHEFLSESYFRYFNGRPFTDSVCYLTITQENKKSRLMSFDNKKWRDFLVKIRKVHDQLRDAGVKSRFLGKTEACEYVDRFFSMNFRDKVVSMTNFKASDEYLRTGDRIIRSYPLVDIDEINLPSMVKPYTQMNINGYGIATDMLSFLTGVPYSDCVVFNQVIQIPGQRKLLRKLQAKAKRHGSMPDPSNRIARADIEEVLDRLAVDSTMLVYCNFNILVSCPPDKVTPVTSFLETKLYECGIMPSRTAYNQLELFMDCFPGNGYAFNPDYDLFLTLSDAALCFFFKEHLKESEDTPLTTYYTDRQGLPVCIDITGKEGKKKMTDNANFFCIGPSGSGKSTLLRSLNLLEVPSKGHIYFDGVDITDKKVDINKHRQKMGMVFQHFNLFPHKTILQNITLAPVKLLKKDKKKRKKKQ